METIKTKPTTNSQPRELTAAEIAGGLIISVGEARKILGATAKGLSDNQIAMFILDFSDFSPLLLNYKHFAK